MVVRYLDKNGDTETISLVTNIQPVGVLEILIETSSTQTPIKLTQLIDITN